MDATESPRLIILAGPNGAGKTTSAQVLLPEVLGIKAFVNADEIARGLSPFDPQTAAIQAGRLMVERMNELLTHRVDFGIETTLAAKSYVRLIRQAQAVGYAIHLVFLYLPSPLICINRVRLRVLSGGHSIAPHIITRRYYAGLRNLIEHYIPLVDSWTVYDNSRSRLETVAEYDRTLGHVQVFNFNLWQQIRHQSKRQSLQP